LHGVCRGPDRKECALPPTEGSVLLAIAFPVNTHMFHWDKELRAIRTVRRAGIGTSASVIYL